MTAYTLTPVGLRGRLMTELTRRVEGPELGRLDLVRENERLRSELDEARRVAAGAQRLQKRFENECALRVRAQKRLNRVAETLASLAHAHPELADVVLAAREGIWRQGDV